MTYTGRRKGRVRHGKRETPARGKGLKLLVMSAEESKEELARAIKRSRENANDDMRDTVLKTQRGMRMNSTKSNDLCGVRSPPKRRMIAAPPSVSNSAVAMLMAHSSPKSPATGPQSLAERAGLRYGSTADFEAAVSRRRHERAAELGQEFRGTQSNALSMAQAEALMDLFSEICAVELESRVRSGRPLSSFYEFPEPGGTSPLDPDHSCMHDKDNKLLCNFIERDAGPTKASGRLFYCTVTGAAHFCSRDTCEYFVRQPTSSFDCCGLTGMCFEQARSSGMSYLSVAPHLRRFRQNVDDDDMGDTAHKTSREVRTAQNHDIRRSVAGLRNQDTRDRVLRQVTAEQGLQGVMTPQAATEAQRRIEVVTADKVRCAVHVNVKDKTLLRERLDMFMQACKRVFLEYHQCTPAPGDLQRLVNVCEKTWLLVVNSSAFLVSSMRYPVFNHPFVVLDLASKSTGHCVSVTKEDGGGYESVSVVPPCKTLVEGAWYTGPMKNTKNCTFKLRIMRQRFKTFIDELANDPDKHHVLRQAHSALVRDGVHAGDTTDL